MMDDNGINHLRNREWWTKDNGQRIRMVRILSGLIEHHFQN